MQFHPTGTDPTREALLVCRNSRWNILAMLAFFWALPVGARLMGAGWWLVVPLGGLALLLTWPMLGVWRKRGQAENWVLALYRDGIWLNLRDCEYQAAAGESIVFFPYGEIASARRYVNRFTTPTAKGGTSYHKHVYLELQLRSADTGELRQALDEERQRDPAPQEYLRGVVRSRTNRRLSAVELVDDATIRIKFSVSNYGLQPSLKKVLATLQQFVAIEDEYVLAAPSWSQLDEKELDDLVGQLVKIGSLHDAVKLLERRKGMSTTEAVEAIDSQAERSVH